MAPRRRTRLSGPDRRAQRRTRRMNALATSPVERTLLGYGLFGMFWGAWGGILPAVQQHAHASDSQLGLALVLIGVGALATMRLTGALIDKRGGNVLPLTGVAFGVVAFVPAAVGDPIALAVSLLLLGAAAGAMDVALSATAVDAEAHTGKPLLNLGNAVFSGAVVVASIAAGVARNAGFVAEGVLGIAGGVLMAVSINALAPAPGDELEVEADLEATPGRLLRRPPTPLLVLGGLGLLAYLVENGWQSWGAVHLHNTLGASAALAAAAPAVFAACAAAGRLAGNRLVRDRSASSVVTAGATLAAGGTVLGALASTSALALVGIGLAGLGTSVCAPTLISVAGRWAGANPDRIGTAGATSTVVTLSYLGFVFGPAVVGLLAGATTLPSALVVVGAVAALLAVLVAPGLRGVERR